MVGKTKVTKVKLSKGKSAFVSHPDTFSVMSLYAQHPVSVSCVFDNGNVGVDLPQGAVEVGQLIDLNHQLFRVQCLTEKDTGLTILAPFKLHWYPDHNPLEVVGIKKEWIKGLKAVAEQTGTTHADIEFMEDMFQDTPVDSEALKYVTVLEAVGDPLPETDPQPDPNQKVPLAKAQEGEEKQYDEVPLDPNEPIVEVKSTYLKVLKCPTVHKQNVLEKTIVLMSTLANLSYSVSSVVVHTNAWAPINLKMMEKFAADISKLEDMGVEFAVKEQ